MRRAGATRPPINPGVRVDGDSHDHYFKCQTCGRLVDMRDLAEVFEHEGPHLPPPKM